MSENCTHNCETCGENCASRKTNPADFREPPHALSSIKKVIGVVSGKGGRRQEHDVRHAGRSAEPPRL